MKITKSRKRWQRITPNTRIIQIYDRIFFLLEWIFFFTFFTLFALFTTFLFWFWFFSLSFGSRSWCVFFFFFFLGQFKQSFFLFLFVNPLLRNYGKLWKVNKVIIKLPFQLLLVSYINTYFQISFYCWLPLFLSSN